LTRKRVGWNEQGRLDALPLRCEVRQQVMQILPTAGGKLIQKPAIDNDMSHNAALIHST
jgi:hypothetical protein